MERDKIDNKKAIVQGNLDIIYSGIQNNSFICDYLFLHPFSPKNYTYSCTILPPPPHKIALKVVCGKHRRISVSVVQVSLSEFQKPKIRASLKKIVGSATTSYV